MAIFRRRRQDYSSEQPRLSLRFPAMTHLQRLLIALLHVGQESLGIIGKEMHLAEIEDLREQVGIDRYIVEKGWLYQK